MRRGQYQRQPCGEQAILLFDIAPTAWFGADLAEITEGDNVAIFGRGPVGPFAILGAKLIGADRIFAVDQVMESGVIHPEKILSKLEGLTDALSAYQAFDKRQSGWLKVEIEPKA